MEINNKAQSSKGKKIIILLIVLLILSLLGLLGRYIYLNHFQKHNSTTVPNNVIEEMSGAGDENDDRDKDKDNSEDRQALASEDQDRNTNTGNTVDNNSGTSNDGSHSDNQNSNSNNNQDGNEDVKSEVVAPEIELDKNNSGDNQRFDVSNMLPGDSVTKFFCVTTHHGFDVKVYFESSISEQTKNLGDVLQIKVTDVTGGADKGKLIAQGTFNEIDQQSFPVQLKENKKGYTKQYYRIDAWLDTSVGNPYQRSKLSADFKWYVTDDEYQVMLAKEPIIPGISTGKDDDKTNSTLDESNATKTGDFFDKTLWVIFIGSAILIVILFIAGKVRKEDE